MSSQRSTQSQTTAKQKKRKRTSSEKRNNRSALSDETKKRRKKNARQKKQALKKRTNRLVNKSNEKAQEKLRIRKKKRTGNKKSKPVQQSSTVSASKKRPVHSSKVSVTSRKSTRKKRNTTSRRKKRTPALVIFWRNFKELIVIAGVTFVVFMVIGAFFLSINKVTGFSMIPTLRDGDTIVVHKTDNVRRMDLVVIQRGNTQQIRRIIGLPGENISYVNDELYVNDSIQNEPFIIEEINEAQRNGGDYTQDFRLVEITGENQIPEDCYLVLGDNRPFSQDSRQYGLIDNEQILGVVKMRLLPINGLQSF